MKKITSLILMLMLVFSGSISAQTLITSLDQLNNHHAYYLKCARGYAYSAANHGQLVASGEDATPMAMITSLSSTRMQTIITCIISELDSSARKMATM